MTFQKQIDLDIGPITPFELGWLCGLWEGEGHFGYDGTQLAHIRMTDLDMIEKSKALIERVLGLPKPIHLLMQNSRPKELPLYGYQTYGATARGIMRLVVPHMSKRRRGQIWRSLNGIRPVKLPAEIIKRAIENANNKNA